MMPTTKEKIIPRKAKQFMFFEIVFTVLWRLVQFLTDRGLSP